ncbi:MAG: fasciclin domain-containing protein [Methanomicrobiales archaeon]|jgi:uncharacterized surface protein with fasciclin (FAS1) repeats|nr:fasciclin domain-containing protein [Methanomicrobiales archaeon]
MKSIIETAREDSRLSISSRIADAGDAAEFLPERGPYTMFIPGNVAYTKIPVEKVEAIANDRERLRDMIMYHVVQGKLTARELARMEAIRTLQGDHLDITSSPEGVLVNDATIIYPDTECTDGIYHIIDRVLIPRAVDARVTRSV